MSIWKRDRDSDLEHELRAGRPVPRPEVTEEIADRVRPRSGFMRGLDRVPLGVAGVLSTAVVVAVIALGGASSTLDAAGNALNFQNAAKGKKDVNTAEFNQYGPRVFICINAQATVRVAGSVADFLISGGVATSGKCPTPPGKIRGDKDGDGVLDKDDNCKKFYNPGQENADGDKRGDVCDRFENDPNRT